MLVQRPDLEPVGRRRRDAGPAPEHPLLRLQRTAGNKAVADLALQREFEAPWEVADKERHATYFDSRVALASPRSIYKGKTDATFGSVSVERHWEWGLLTDDIAIVFECGPKRFRFETTKGGGGLFPWGILDRFGDTGGWSTEPVAKALTTLYHHWDDEQLFWPARKVVVEALKGDVEQYRDLEKGFWQERAAKR